MDMERVQVRDVHLSGTMGYFVISTVDTSQVPYVTANALKNLGG